MEFSGNYVLSDLSCSIEFNSKIGLIGPNGCGKSTLLRVMLGNTQATEGTVSIAKKCKVAYLAQNMQIDTELKMRDYVMSSRKDIRDLWQQIESLSSELHISHDALTEEILSKAINKYQSLGGFEYENEVKYILTMFSFPESVWDKAVSDFSGGEQTRIRLAYILLSQYDLLILDEPTNHLDIAMIAWLEKYLNKLDKPFLVVSHDRAFLDNVVSTIFFLNEGRIFITKGNYSSFKGAWDIEQSSRLRQYERQQKWLEETRDFIRRNMAGQKTVQAACRLKQIQKTEIIDKPTAKKAPNLNIKISGRSGNDVFVLQDAELGIQDLSLARDINLFAHYQDRICIIGPNGCGKTTLIKTLLGEQELQAGILKIGASLDIGYYDQHQMILNSSQTVKESFWQIIPDATIGYVLSWLARFGFRGDDVDKKIEVLSGGEKSRLYLCHLIHQNPNLLILDEPTNHLDIEMSDALLSALESYQGTIIFVSHDRYFVKSLANKYWVFRKKVNGNSLYSTVEETDGDLDTAIELSFGTPEVPREEPKARERKKKINPWHLQQLSEKIEAANLKKQQLEDQISKIHLQLASSESYTNPLTIRDLNATLQSCQDDLIAISNAIADLEDQYLEMSYE